MIYTQPQAFNRNRLLVQLLTVVAVVMALVMGLSVFFKIENIHVSGAEVYSEWAVREASGLTEGDNLLTFSHARSAALIKANLPYVDTVRFGIKLPDTVNIIVKEDDVVYAIKDQNGQWWLMNSEGRIVEMGDNASASDHTQIHGVVLEDPVVDERAVAMEMVSQFFSAQISAIFCALASFPCSRSRSSQSRKNTFVRYSLSSSAYTAIGTSPVLLPNTSTGF